MTLVLAGGNRWGCSMVVLHQGGRGRPDSRCKSTFFDPISLGEWSTKLNQNPTENRPFSLYGSNHLVHFWKLSKGPFFAESHKSHRPLSQEKDPLAQYAANTADPSCLIGVHNQQCVCVLQCEYYYMNTSYKKFCRENTSLGQKLDLFTKYWIDYSDVKQSNCPYLIDINSDVSDWNLMDASIVVNAYVKADCRTKILITKQTNKTPDVSHRILNMHQLS